MMDEIEGYARSQPAMLSEVGGELSRSPGSSMLPWGDLMASAANASASAENNMAMLVGF